MGDDSERVFEESNNDEEAAKVGEIAVSSVNLIQMRAVEFPSLELREKDKEFAHGLIGSDIVSNQSSILDVCSRMASSGLADQLGNDRSQTQRIART